MTKNLTRRRVQKVSNRNPTAGRASFHPLKDPVSESILPVMCVHVHSHGDDAGGKSLKRGVQCHLPMTGVPP